MTGSTKSMDEEVFNARSNGQDIPARDRRELCQGLTKPFGPDPLHHLLDLHDSLGLGIGCWLAVEPPAHRMDTCPTDPPGIPGLSRLHSRRLADRCGRRDHRARVPAAQGMGYAGACFHFSGAVASHLLAGDWSPISTWFTPLVFLMFGMVSWALRPADRRLLDPGLGPETRPRAWAVPIGILLLLSVVSYLMLPWVNAAMHKRALDLGWIAG